MKRKICTICAFVLTALASFALNNGTNKLFVTEGKTWTCEGYQALSPYTGMDRFETTYFFQGDSVIEGKNYKCLYYRKSYAGGYRLTELTDLLRQDGDKVYSHKGTLIYEFGLRAGEVSENGWEVTAVGDTVLNDGIQRRFLKVKYEGMYTDGNPICATDIWVEGIGSLETGMEKDYQLNLPGSTRYTLKEVSHNGKYIYNKTKKGYRMESMLAENKLWHCQKWDSGFTALEDRYYYFQGDTVIAEKVAKKMNLIYSKENETGIYQAALYEDGERIYICQAGQMEFSLLYDFGVRIGERICVQGVQCNVIGKDEISIKGCVLRRIHLSYNEEGETITNVWTEGFGGLVCPISASVPLPGTYESVIGCEVDGEPCLERSEMEAHMKYPSWVGATWSYFNYESNHIDFLRYTVLDEPKSIDGKIYFPMVQYSSCEYSPTEEKRRWYIRQEDNFVYMLKTDSPDYGNGISEGGGIQLGSRGNEYVLYDFNYTMNKLFCNYVETGYTYRSISMTDTATTSIEGGQTHRMIIIEEGEEAWIDGIGSTWDLMRPCSTERPDGPYGKTLNYFRSANGKTVYINPLKDCHEGFKYNDCAVVHEELPPTDIESTVSGESFIRTNVTSSTLHCTAPDAIKLEVYTIDAMKVGEARFVDGQAEVKVNEAPATYLYIVTYPDGRRESGKVVGKG